jgi:DNA replication licensing factor MCM2
LRGIARLRGHGSCFDPSSFPLALPPRPQQDPEIIPQEMLRKYITYAKQNCRPQLQQADYERLMEFYSKLRQEAARTHGMPIAVRHLESLIRMSEAHAKMHLREYVMDEDINMAIKQLLGSFIQSQKYSVHKTMERRFKRYLTFGSDYHQLLLSMLRGLLQEVQREVRLQGLSLEVEEQYWIPISQAMGQNRNVRLSGSAWCLPREGGPSVRCLPSTE